MNSLNLRQIDGGNVIKQADFGSNLSFELLDERRRKIPELDGQTATIRLIKGDNIAYQTESQVVDGSVSFKFDRVLEKGIYVLEIVAGNYVFPSNNMLKITIEKTAGNYKPENMIKTDLVELQGKITAIEQREHDINQELLDVGQKQAEMTKRIETLESREDNDTIYDDTEIKQSIAKVDNKMSGLSEKVTALEERPTVDTALTERVEALERKEDKDTVYDDTAIKKELNELNQSIAKKKLYYAYTNDENGVDSFTKADVYDSFYCLVFNYLGISEKDSDNPDDYFWMPTRGASDDELSKAIFEVNKLKDLHRKAPTGYTLDRTTIPWTVWFDNGCGLQMSEYGTTATVYGYGFSASYIDNSIVTFPIIPNIMRVSNGSLTIEKIKTLKGSADYWSPSIKIINPIRDRDDYDWANARFNPEALSTNHYSSVRQQYFIRTMYELGIWSESDVEGFGAVKK